MKRKNAVLEHEEPQEIPVVKKRKSRTKREVCEEIEQSEDIQITDNNITQQSSRRKGNKTEFNSVSSSVLPETTAQKKKRKRKSDITQNGDAVHDTKVLKNSNINKGKKKNGLQNRADSESPSDFQPLGQLIRKEKAQKKTKSKILPIDEIKLKPKDTNTVKKPLKQKQPKKVESTLDTSVTDSIQNCAKTEDEDFDEEVKKPKRKKQFQEDENIKETTAPKYLKPELPLKRPKKKVRIDETESLKVKKEMADTESHFSVRELPAKIIKSKLNKNLTEEVKVSPLTIQELKKEKKIHHKKPKMDKLQKRQQYSGEIAKNEELQIISDKDSNSEESDLEVYYINKTAEREAKKKDKQLAPKNSILMPKEDQLVLVKRIQEVIPETDTKSYKYTNQKLEWEKIAFKNYSLEDCQTVWNQLLKKVRHYRLLVEMTHDVIKVIEQEEIGPNPKNIKPNNKKHPDMPKRPLTSYFLYYIRKRDKIVKERPELDTLALNKFIGEKYHNLPLEKKHKYESLAFKNREEYKKQMEEFYAKHPEMRKVIMKKTKPPKERKESAPKRPPNPYKLFMQAELNREEIADEDKAEFKEVCREKWRQMSDTKKLLWINLAEDQNRKYEEDLKQYMATHPEYTVKARPKAFLSREEMKLKDKLAGKPKKPPGTAYGLFISMTLQSNEIVNILPKERWVYTSTKWKAMSDEEREQYKQLLAQVHEQYEKDFKTYLDSLPEDKRQEEILLNMPKKRKNALDKPSTSGTKTKTTPTKTQPSRRKNVASSPKPKAQHPIPPPRSVFKYFSEKFNGENPKEAWKNLDEAAKDKYEKELSLLKDKYIKDFETFLKGLTKEELAAFCANRSAQKDFSSSGESDSESEHGDSEPLSSDDASESSGSDESDEN